MHPNVHSSFIYNRQDIEATRVYISRIKKTWCACACVCARVRAVEYYAAIKKESLPFAATWMDWEGIMLSEISQIERHTLCDTTYIWNFKKDS